MSEGKEQELTPIQHAGDPVVDSQHIVHGEIAVGEHGQPRVGRYIVLEPVEEPGDVGRRQVLDLVDVVAPAAHVAGVAGTDVVGEGGGILVLDDVVLEGGDGDGVESCEELGELEEDGRGDGGVLTALVEEGAWNGAGDEVHGVEGAVDAGEVEGEVERLWGGVVSLGQRAEQVELLVYSEGVVQHDGLWIRFANDQHLESFCDVRDIL